MKPKKEKLTAEDRAKALDIKGADMYVFNMKHALTGEIYSQEQFMVVRCRNGRKYVFRQKVDLPQKPSGILT